MIISASRRTDIPSFYFDWFLNRLKVGEVLVRNPMNHGQISRVVLSPDVVECIAFWTKNPAPMLPRLKDLHPYPFFVQFSLNPYGPEIERNLPAKAELVETFLRLGEAIGPERLIWRYSPVLFNETYTEARQLDFFGSLCERLRGHTSICRLSFLDMYPKIEKRMNAQGIAKASQNDQVRLAKEFRRLAAASEIRLGACGNLDLAAAGFEPLGCIDRAVVEKTIGYPIQGKKDNGQRDTCYCLESVDIGSYQTCLNGCSYCYANHSEATAARNALKHHPESSMLCDQPGPADRITDRKPKSLAARQHSLIS